jgi:hypothetical protein
MKKIMLATAMVALYATTASAFELGKTGVFFDTDTKAYYSVENKAWDTTTTEFKLNKDVADGLNVYTKTTVDLQDVKFNGVEVGVDYMPVRMLTNADLTLKAAVRTDENFKYSDTIVGLEYKF